MSQIAFGAGVLIGTALTDASGNALAAPTPVQFGILQEVSVDISADVKELFGSYQFPVAVGRGKAKITGKAKFAQINGLMLNTLFFGQTLSTGILSDAIDVAAVIPSTPFQVTPTVPGSGTWTLDLGVKNAGVPMQRVVSAPTTGQYSVSAGVYTFAAADVGAAIAISFQYTATSTIAKKSTVSNVLMGYAPAFRVDLYQPYAGKALTIQFPQAIGTKLTLATKLDDFMIPEFDFSCFADASNNVMYYGTSE